MTVVKKMLCVVMLAWMSSAVQASTIYYEDFGADFDIANVTATKGGTATWSGVSVDTAYYNSSPSSLRVAGSGGSGSAYASGSMSLGSYFDFWADGDGSASVMFYRYTGINSVRIYLYSDDTELVNYYTTDIYGGWVNIDIPLNDQCTAVNKVVFQITRNTGTSGFSGYFDDLTVVPEPATMALCAMGLFGVMIKRRK